MTEPREVPAPCHNYCMSCRVWKPVCSGKFVTDLCDDCSRKILSDLQEMQRAVHSVEPKR